MTTFDQLNAAAFKSERAASRRLARLTGVDLAEALRRTLERAAGTAGLSSLLATRASLNASQKQQAVAGQLARQAKAQQAWERKLAARTIDSSAWNGWFDGSALPNPGRCGIGAVLRGPDASCVEISRCAGHGSSSDAEYRALIALLEAAVRHRAQGLCIHGDSRVVIDDVNAVTAPASALDTYRTLARALLAQLPGARLLWIPRQRNAEADALSQRAVRAAQQHPP
ncbi:MAG: ribonuclease HI family protein [Pseudomonadota bacterium]